MLCLLVFTIVDVNPLMNQNKPLCVNCKFFIKHKNECSQFGYVDIITGKKNYENAISVRNNKHKCGDTAVSFVKNHFRWITDPYYFVVEHWVLVFLFTSYLIPIVWLFYN
jgi:hypothetical protein